jgi:hypothetical protein
LSDITHDSSDASETRSDSVDLRALAAAASELGATQSVSRKEKLEIYLFFSFDLVGSTALKAPERTTEFDKFSWVEVIQHFYGICRQAIRDFSIGPVSVWKYVGDEVLFYLQVTDRKQIGKCVSAVFQTLDYYVKELSNSQYSEAAKYISVKAVAWLTPVRRYVKELAAEHEDKCKDFSGRFVGDDRILDNAESDENRAALLLDFLGPNIDAGFRISKFARKKQLVVSPGLAYYLFKNGSANNLRIVAFDELKGVAGGAVYPGIWYNENWPSIQQVFDYQERYRDDLVGRICSQSYYQIEMLETDIKPAFKKLGYLFEPELIDEIIAISAVT